MSDLRQELAVRQKERRPSSSLGKDADRGDAPSAANPSIPATPSKPISSTFATPPASSIRRGWWMDHWNYCSQVTARQSYLVVCVSATGDGLTGTPLTTSARISALNIVGELLRKVGVSLADLSKFKLFDGTELANVSQQWGLQYKCVSLLSFYHNSLFWIGLQLELLVSLLCYSKWGC